MAPATVTGESGATSAVRGSSCPRPRTTVGHSGNSFVAFSDYAIWGDQILYPFGDARPGMGRIVKTDRRLRFEPDTRIFVEGEIDYTLDSGDVKRVHYERIGGADRVPPLRDVRRHAGLRHPPGRVRR